LRSLGAPGLRIADDSVPAGGTRAVQIEQEISRCALSVVGARRQSARDLGEPLRARSRCGRPVSAGSVRKGGVPVSGEPWPVSPPCRVPLRYARLRGRVAGARPTGSQFQSDPPRVVPRSGDNCANAPHTPLCPR